MQRLEHPLYLEDLETVASCGADWSQFEGATIGISGATGMVGTFLIDMLMQKVRAGGFDVSIVALGRDEQRARNRLPYFDEPSFMFEEYDVAKPGVLPRAHADVVIHLASTTHPRAYATQPIATITSNVFGLQNLIEWQLSSAEATGRFCFVSSVEVYGQNRSDVERFDEQYSGYIDCNTLRAGYPESKRLGESLCQAYAAERGASVYIPRLPRIYGPTLLASDTKALSQFLHKGVTGENVVLKSAGTQVYSYLHVVDAVSGLLWVLTRGEAGVAYNAADPSGDIALCDLAALIARQAGAEVVFENPDTTERAGYSTATKAILDGSRLRTLGWSVQYDLEKGVQRTIEVLRETGWR